MATRRTKRTDGRYSVNFTYEDRDGIKRRAVRDRTRSRG